MTKKILSYQTNAINAAIEHLQENKEFKLQSPTGSGKTFIISQIIDKYLENGHLNAYPTTFIFIAPSTGALDYQGYEKITSYLNKDWAKGYTTEYIGTSKQKSSSKSYLSNIDYFKPNTCYFFGWQMFKKGTRITKIDSERNDIYKVISNTKMKDINIVLIIDEAHREVASSKDDINTKQIIINDLDPFKIIKVSATLEEKDINPDFKIDYDDVRADAAIKQNVIIAEVNSKVKDINKYNEEEQLIISAIEKQKEVKQQLEKKQLDINPLILIQIPDKVTIDKEIANEDLLLKRIESILDKQRFKKGYNYSIWLSDDKTIKNKEDIVNNKSPIEILIFKTAIATGWDIPRANMLVRIREAKTKAFNIQTLGRILRNPFFKYYNNDLIDNAFVFTKDEKYKEYIKNEKIVSAEEDFIEVERSERAKNSQFSINKKIIDIKDYDEQEMIDKIVSIILDNKQFVKDFLSYEHPQTTFGEVKINASDVLSGDEDTINKEIEQKDKYLQPLLKFNGPRITLFDLYVKYRTITKSKEWILKVLTKLELGVKKFNKSIKDFYWACCYNWDRPIFEGKFTLKEKIEIEKDNYLKDKIENRFEVYNLPLKYKINSKYFDKNWDNFSTFKIGLNFQNLSENEKEFYKSIRNIIEDDEYKHIHFFRNGTSNKNDFYIEYIDSENKNRKFFPDFIIINEKDKECFIFEAKGLNKKDIDKESENKLKSIDDGEVLKEISNNGFKLINGFYKVSYQTNKGEPVFSEYLPNVANIRNREFKDIKKLILKKGDMNHR